mmetsp:Transcript_22813/g.44843  ORF Transcript_22813/g.44843 Transcript_22813/m.44843 type:complete len:170 (+) Transcript_22813:215-724(+)|eukprot:CAMPEP_0171498398 /NCGR_PEP_ID=MMETSP0958-20121227/7827_1 /TAXON_ID=87120 /ORGANISM="Aurantiochytrium limacinum, Strain ATCCMYA-1381" /LENGTH=169 /DNA_ID=CAMNT_0012032791 /DNA_START=148 /DNA_END=657 /DNA_ORIENTATION=+
MSVSVPSWAIEVMQKLPAPLQERVQAVMMRSAEDKYFLAMTLIPLAFMQAYIPHFAGFSCKLLSKGFLTYNNDTPRAETYDGLLGSTIKRCSGAHLNSLESFPLFAAAMLIARSRDVSPQVMLAQGAKYLKLRMIYIVLYMFGVNQLLNTLRTYYWGKCIGQLLQICEI